MKNTDRDMVKAWLQLQCSMVAGVNRAVLVLAASNASEYHPVAAWPENAQIPPSMPNAAHRAIREHHPVLEQTATDSKNGGLSCHIVACPVLVDGKLLGALAVEMTGRTDQKQRAALQVFSWGTACLEILLKNQAAAAENRFQVLVEVIAQAVAHNNFTASAMAVANTLADQLACERVSIGFVKGRDIPIIAISNTARIDEKNNFVRGITAAMHESVDQDVSIVVPEAYDDAAMVTSVHRDLYNQLGKRCLCTVPLTGNTESVGAMTLERDGSRPFDAETVLLCESLASIVGPILNSKRQSQRSPITKLRTAIGDQYQKLFGPKHLVLKTGTILVVGLLSFVSVVQSDYRIDAKAGLEGIIQRVVVSPFEGFLAEAPVRAGDIVERGQLLCRLDDKDLSLERAKWAGEKAQLIKAQREALATHDRTEVSQLNARLDQAEAELALVEERLAKTQVTAPLSGLVVSGDLSQSLGVPIERGQVLFEVAPLDSYRIMLKVNEREIADVRPGQRGQLALSGFPHNKHAFTVDRILPVSVAEDGGNFFQVEARLEKNNNALRPGMQGVGKINAGPRRLIWIWTHRIIDWLSLTVWSWWG